MFETGFVGWDVHPTSRTQATRGRRCMAADSLTEMAISHIAESFPGAGGRHSFGLVPLRGRTVKVTPSGPASADAWVHVTA